MNSEIAFLPQIKTMRTLLFLLLTFPVWGQMYHRTGKNLGFTLGVNTGSIASTDVDQNISGSFGLIHMVVPGIFLKGGYTYTQRFFPENVRVSTLPEEKGHQLDASVLIDKRILKFVDGHALSTSYGCHYFSLGLIAAPEYHYHLNSADRANLTPHEFTGLIGLSLCHIYKNKGRMSMGRTTQYDLFYRHGFTPYFTSVNGDKFKRFELGIQIRRIKHQVKNSIR